MIDSTTALAIFVVCLGLGGLLCGAVLFAAIWRNEAIFVRPEYEPKGELFAFPTPPPPAPPRRPFDHDRDRWEW